MHILCTICSDLVNPAESLYVTKCGHLFHHQCLAQWIERSKTCPQCRNKVTDRCMFRMYPTVSNESSGEDAATLQARLDDAMLQLRTQRTEHNELRDKLASLKEDLIKTDELRKAAERRQARSDAAVPALREQIDYLKVQNMQVQSLKHENEQLKKNMQTLNGLQKVLNATAGEVEDTLKGYSDLRTLATFAAALKRALCDSEAKKRSCRELQHSAEQRLAAMRARYDDLQGKLTQAQESLTSMERKYEALKHKRKASADAGPAAAKLSRPAPAPASAPADSPAPAPAPASAPAAATPRRVNLSLDDAIVGETDVSFGTALSRIMSSDSPYLLLKQSGLALTALQPRRHTPANLKGSALSRIMNSDSPYLLLKQSGLALTALQPRRHTPANLKPSEFAILRSAPTSIFHKPAPLEPPRDLDTAFTCPSPSSPSPSSPARAPSPPPYDGLGGHARPDVFPAPRPKVPRMTSKHKLTRFHSAGSRDISQMFADLRDRN